jgi:lipoprotein-releasing system permease protein
MNFPFYIARRYLVSKKSTQAINIIALISVTGISICTAALIIVLSAMNRMTDLVLSLYNSFDPDLKITPERGKTFEVTDPFKAIQKIPGVLYYSEVLQENALFKHGEKQHIGTIKGVDGNFGKMSGLDSFIVSGNFDLGSDTMPMALAGGGIAAKLDLVVNQFHAGSLIQIFIPRKEARAATTQEDVFHIGYLFPSAIFSLNDDFDFRYLITSLDYLRNITDAKNKATSIELKLEKNVNESEIRKKIQTLTGPGFQIKNRFEQNEVLFKTLKSEKWWTLVILAFIMIIGTFNVIGCVTMLILEKQKDMFVLASLGAGIKTLRKIFMVEGLMIVFLGSLIGIFTGLLLCYLQIQYKLVPFSEGFIIDHYPIRVMGTDVMITLGLVLITGYFAGWYPIRKLTRIQRTVEV